MTPHLIYNTKKNYKSDGQWISASSMQFNKLDNTYPVYKIIYRMCPAIRFAKLYTGYARPSGLQCQMRRGREWEMQLDC